MSTRFYKEEVGFEPTERVNVRQFSRLLQSTALALLHTIAGCIFILHYQYYLSITSFYNKKQNPKTEFSILGFCSFLLCCQLMDFVTLSDHMPYCILQ